jgi:hypothetical protein
MLRYAGIRRALWPSDKRAQEILCIMATPNLLRSSQTARERPIGDQTSTSQKAMSSWGRGVVSTSHLEKKFVNEFFPLNAEIRAKRGLEKRALLRLSKPRVSSWPRLNGRHFFRQENGLRAAVLP